MTILDAIWQYDQGGVADLRVELWPPNWAFPFLLFETEVDEEGIVRTAVGEIPSYKYIEGRLTT